MAEEPCQKIEILLPVFIREAAEFAAEHAARLVIAEHVKTCPIAEVKARVDENDRKISKLEIRLATLIGLMFGSGLLSGGAVALFSKL